MKKQKPKKTPHKGDKKEKLDLSSFTLPSKDEDDQTEKTENTSFVVNLETIESEQDGLFWGTKIGKAWIIGFICLIIFSFAICILIFRLGTQNETPINSEDGLPTVSASTSPAFSPSPSPTIVNKTIYKIRVLNGSGISGEAARVRALLETDGFVVSDIGNAPENNYQEGVISTKKQAGSEIVSEIMKVLNLYIFSEKTSELAEDEDVDVVIIVGPKQ